MSESDNFSPGMGALIGRAIGEINGMQRRIDSLERTIAALQERQQAQVSRREMKFQAFFLVAQVLLVVGLIAGVKSWPAIQKVL
ncbi:MAG: hypothetical protein ACOYLQ_10795 [Hyphomicrobiaceae bacterium]|jgi:hypothetical protein